MVRLSNSAGAAGAAGDERPTTGVAQQNSGQMVQLLQQVLHDHVHLADKARRALESAQVAHRFIALSPLSPTHVREKNTFDLRPIQGAHGYRIRDTAAKLKKVLSTATPSLESLDRWVRSRSRPRHVHACGVSGYRLMPINDGDGTDRSGIVVTLTSESTMPTTADFPLGDLLVLAHYGAIALDREILRAEGEEDDDGSIF